MFQHYYHLRDGEHGPMIRPPDLERSRLILNPNSAHRSCLLENTNLLLMPDSQHISGRPPHFNRRGTTKTGVDDEHVATLVRETATTANHGYLSAVAGRGTTIPEENYRLVLPIRRRRFQQHLVCTRRPQRHGHAKRQNRDNCYTDDARPRPGGPSPVVCKPRGSCVRWPARINQSQAYQLPFFV